MKFIPQTAPSPLCETLRYYKVDPSAFAPEWSTEHASCFDLRACLPADHDIKLYAPTNEPMNVRDFHDDVHPSVILIRPLFRALIATGLIFDIPVGFSIRLHPRSGLSLKEGLVLANQEGVIDSDYVLPTFVILHNLSTVNAVIVHGDRIAQAEMIPDLAYEVLETTEKPKQKTNRIGGLGSTGIQ